MLRVLLCAAYQLQTLECFLAASGVFHCKNILGNTVCRPITVYASTHNNIIYARTRTYAHAHTHTHLINEERRVNTSGCFRIYSSFSILRVTCTYTYVRTYVAKCQEKGGAGYYCARAIKLPVTLRAAWAYTTYCYVPCVCLAVLAALW